MHIIVVYIVVRNGRGASLGVHYPELTSALYPRVSSKLKWFKLSRSPVVKRFFNRLNFLGNRAGLITAYFFAFSFH